VRPYRLGLITAVGVVAIPIERLGGGHGALAVSDAAVGLAFLLGGVAVRERGTRLAQLFFATGIAWFLGSLADSGFAVLASAGSALLYIHRGPLVHLLVAYPDGRLRSRIDRAVVAIAYADGALVPVAQHDAATLVLAAAVVTVGLLRVRGATSEQRPARALATGCAALVASTLALESASVLIGSTALSPTALLLTYECELVIVACALAVGVRAARTTPTAVADLVIEVGAAPRSGPVRETLARAFGDPSLEIAYRDGAAYVDQDGTAVRLPASGNGRAVTLVERDGEPVAALVHDAALAEDTSLMDAVAAAAGLSADNALLNARLQTQLLELLASRRRSVEVGDAQRARLERRLNQAVDLHLREMRSALARASEAAPATAAGALAVVERELGAAEVELHEFARGIHPHTLSERGLAPALAELADRAPIPVAVDVTAALFPTTVEAAAYFVCAEALANVAKYAHSRSASIEVLRAGDVAVVRVVDKGIGGADPSRGSGLRGLGDRIAAIGGCLTVVSPPGQGTSVVAEILLEEN